MVTFNCTASRHDGVTLVTISLADIDVPTRVDVRNCLDGPVWPPRCEGLPEAGWTEQGFRGVVTPGSHAFGYATPAPPDGAPARLTDAEPAPDAEPVGELTDSPDAVLRELGDPSPPADAVPAVDGESGPGLTDEKPEEGLSRQERDPSALDSPTSGTADQAGLESAHRPDAAHDGQQADLPHAVGPWMAEMARRVDHAEALAAVETVPEATTAVRAAGGLADVRKLAGGNDERQLRLLARRARALADRRAAATVPVETLSALA